MITMYNRVSKKVKIHASEEMKYFNINMTKNKNIVGKIE
jgi:hypothetical protein